MAGEMHVAKVNSLARLAMRRWQEPSRLGYAGQRKWQAWALGIACQGVRDFRITGEFRKSETGEIGWTLYATIPAPVIPDALYAEWQALPPCGAELPATKSQAPSSTPADVGGFMRIAAE